jgi:hypothetical protein
LHTQPEAVFAFLQNRASKILHMCKPRDWQSLRAHSALLLLVFSLNGCTAPVFAIHRAAVVGPGGSGKASDLKILNDRGVTRDAVQKQLGFIDTGSSTASFFWGRWIRKWDIYWIGTGGGVLERWGTHNVIVEFGKDGLVSHWDSVDDEKLLRKLIPVLKRNGASGIPAPQLPLNCRFQLTGLTEVRAKPPQLKKKGQDLIRLQFKGVWQNKNSVCRQEMSTLEAVAIVSYLISTGRESVFK